MPSRKHLVSDDNGYIVSGLDVAPEHHLYITLPSHR